MPTNQASNTVWRFESEMLIVKPILTDTTLYHLPVFLPIWVRVRLVARAVQAFEVMVVRILGVLYIFAREKLTGQSSKLGVPTITSEISLSPELQNLHNQNSNVQPSINKLNKIKNRQDIIWLNIYEPTNLMAIVTSQATGSANSSVPLWRTCKARENSLSFHVTLWVSTLISLVSTQHQVSFLQGSQK